MTTQAKATFTIKSWDEQPYDEHEGLQKMTRASVTNQYEGDIEGTGTLEYLMVYGEDGSATYVGLERIVGRLAGRTGSFVLQNSGGFENGVARVKWQVVPGSGTGELRGLLGEGGYDAGHEEPHPVTLDYSFE